MRRQDLRGPSFKKRIRLLPPSPPRFFFFSFKHSGLVWEKDSTLIPLFHKLTVTATIITIIHESRPSISTQSIHASINHSTTASDFSTMSSLLSLAGDKGSNNVLSINPESVIVNSIDPESVVVNVKLDCGAWGILQRWEWLSSGRTVLTLISRYE